MTGSAAIHRRDRRSPLTDQSDAVHKPLTDFPGGGANGVAVPARIWQINGAAGRSAPPDA
jgi:hypothetical protein